MMFILSTTLRHSSPPLCSRPAYSFCSTYRSTCPSRFVQRTSYNIRLAFPSALEWALRPDVPAHYLPNPANRDILVSVVQIQVWVHGLSL